MAKSEAMFYSADPEEIRRKATFYAFLFIMFGVITFFAAIAQLYGNVSVSYQVSFIQIFSLTFSQLGEKIASTIRSQLFEAIMRRSVAFFDHEENSAGPILFLFRCSF